MAKKKMYTGTVTMENGKRKYVRSTSKEGFDKKMLDAQVEAGKGVDLTDDTTFGEFAQLWYENYKKPYLRENSLEHIRYVLNKHIMPKLALKPLRSITPMQIRSIMGSLSGFSQELNRKTLQILRSIFDAAVENHLISTSPVPANLHPGGIPTKEEIPLTIEQSQRLLRATKGTRAYIAVALMLGAGLRREEVCGLMWKDINFRKGVIKVQHAKAFHSGRGEVSEQLKSRAAYREIPLQDWLLEALREAHRASGSEFVLSMPNGDSITHSSWQKLWKVIQTRTTDNPKLLGQPISPRHPSVKYELDFHCHPHQLRHTCVTRWIEAGLDMKEVQYLAGHATPDMTMRLYAHYDLAGRKEITAQKMRESALLAQLSV